MSSIDLSAPTTQDPPMFQIFEPASDRGYAGRHLPLLRAELADLRLDGFYIPHDDEYQNEYIPAYAERLMWVSGFSGSAGAAIVMQGRAIIFVDGRYTLQVRQQVASEFYEYEDIAEMSPYQWLADNVKSGVRIGYDPMVVTSDGVSRLAAAALKGGFSLVGVEVNPIDTSWLDQPTRPLAKVSPHGTEFSGQSSSDKRTEIAEFVTRAGADALLVTAPTSIAWLFNVRGGDVSRTPLPLGRAILASDGRATLFIAPEKIGNELSGYLGDGVDIRAEGDVDDALEKLGRTGANVAIDAALAPASYVQTLRDAGANIVELTDPCALPRACKNATEISGTKAAHIRDGVAVTHFLHWVATKAQGGDVDEIMAAKTLENFRSASGQLADLSFDSISAAGPHGAICHYKVSTESNITLDRDSLYLIDSGGQYSDGTTDITRTVAIGQATEEMCDRFTRVLKGHIALASAVFPVGTTGHQLDILARKPLWEVGLDYDHGTGHGVGSFLGVHEGPQRISKASNTQALRPGMILSNEPGFYKSGEFGIRIENLVVVREPAAIAGGERKMMRFDTITLAPISLDLITQSLLTDVERQWLNQYHERVRETLGPLVTENVREWLARETREI